MIKMILVVILTLLFNGCYRTPPTPVFKIIDDIEPVTIRVKPEDAKLYKAYILALRNNSSFYKKQIIDWELVKYEYSTNYNF